MKYYADQWAQRLDLKQKGGDYVGACPVCGGKDRFHVSISADLVGCRGCIDGEPADVRRESYRRIVKATFGGARVDQASTVPRPARKERPKLTPAEVKAEVEGLIARAEYTTHAYLDRKGFPNQTWAVVEREMIVPVRRGKEWLSVQRIGVDGEKKFIWRTRVAGGYYRLGRGEQAVVVEGLATGLSVYAALQAVAVSSCVYVAFSLGNIPAVAERLRPGSLVIVDCDADAKAHAKAERVMQACGERHLHTWMPPEHGDANDWHLAHGLESLQANILSSLRSA